MNNPSERPLKFEQDSAVTPVSPGAAEGLGGLAISSEPSDRLQGDLTAEQMSLYHPRSVNPTQRHETLVHEYSRNSEQYERELQGMFHVEDWAGKKVLDIGAGGRDTFAGEARAKGVNVVSLNPALQYQEHRDLLHEGRAIQAEHARDDVLLRRRDLSWWQRPLKAKSMQKEYNSITEPNISSVAGLGQQLPFRDETFDALVSVFGIPHYLHYVDGEYTPAVREQDKQLIRQAFGEMTRVLKPGGKGFTADLHRGIDQTSGAGFSYSDGTEVIEVLDELRAQGYDYEVHLRNPGPVTGRPVDETRSVERTIVLTKPQGQ